MRCGAFSAEERLHGGLDDFYAQEAEMERQLGTDIKTVWLNKLGSARRACRVARA